MLKFNKPKNDVCDRCEVFSNTSPDQRKDDVNLEHAKHMEEKEAARVHMKESQDLAKADKKIYSAAVVPKLLRVGTHYLLLQLTATHLTLFNQQNIDKGN